VQLNGTNVDAGPTLIWSAGGLEDGDHQFNILFEVPGPNGSLAVDYFEYVVPLLHFVTKKVS